MNTAATVDGVFVHKSGVVPTMSSLGLVLEYLILSHVDFRCSLIERRSKFITERLFFVR